MQRWKKLSQEERKIGFKTVIAKQFLLPDGQQDEFITWNRPDANIATIALTPEGKVVIARQFRPGPEEILDELPGGGTESGEDPATAAARELLEETGYVSDEPFELLGAGIRDAYANPKNYYFLAHNCYQTGKQRLEATEFVEVALISIAELIENAKNARMSDGLAVLMAYNQLQKELNGKSN